MKVARNTSGQFARRSLSGRGCAPFFVLIAVAMSVVALGRDWIGQWLNLNRSQRITVSLSAARAAFDDGDLNAAVDYAQQVLAHEPRNQAAYELLIRSLIFRSYSEFGREADRERALSFSADAVSKFPRHTDIQAVRAYALQASGLAEEARRVALRVIERSPDHVLARTALSLAYGSEGVFEAALREAELAVSLADRYRSSQLESYRALGIAHGDLGNYRQAMVELDRAISVNEKLIPLHFEAALFALQVSDIDRATVTYYRIMALDEGNIKVRARLCELSNRLQERQSALRYCLEVTELAPDLAEGWHNLGREYFLSGDFSAAQDAFEQCARLQLEQDARGNDLQLACWYLQGQSAEILGDCDSLTTIYREFLDLVRRRNLPQTWSYPPGGPPICAANASMATRQRAAP